MKRRWRSPSLALKTPESCTSFATFCIRHSCAICSEYHNITFSAIHLLHASHLMASWVLTPRLISWFGQKMHSKQCKKLLEEGSVMIKEDKSHFGHYRLLLHVKLNFSTELKFILAFKYSLHLSQTSDLTTKFLHSLQRKPSIKIFFLNERQK